MKSFDSLIGAAARAALRDDRRVGAVASRIVPGAVLAHARFWRLDGKRLHVTLDSAVWVARLRFEERRLLDALAAEGIDAHELRCHVAPAESPAAPRRSTRQGPEPASAAAVRALETAAAAVAGDAAEADDPLARQMRRIARRLAGDDRSSS